MYLPAFLPPCPPPSTVIRASYSSERQHVWPVATRRLQINYTKSFSIRGLPAQQQQQSSTMKTTTTMMMMMLSLDRLRWGGSSYPVGRRIIELERRLANELLFSVPLLPSSSPLKNFLTTRRNHQLMDHALLNS